MSHYKPYPAYKDSGVEWLGRVPEHWGVRKLKWLASLQSGDFITSETIEEEGTYPVYGGNGLRGYSTAFTHEGAYALVGRQGALCGNINYAEGKFWASEHAVVVSPYVPTAVRWLGELLRAMNLGQYSISSAQPGLAVERIIDLFLPVPPEGERQIIAAHMGRETARIDALIEKKTRFIELLREKRQALITHAVTKGLDPKVKMKDSGVEWLGEVPEHWGVRSFKHLAGIRYGIGEPPAYKAEGTPLIRATNVDAGCIRSEGLVYVDPADIPDKRIIWLAPGDIIVVRSGAYTGDSAIVQEHHCPAIAGFDMVVSPKCVNPFFLQYALLSRYLKSNQIDLEKMRAAQPHLNAEELGSCFVLLPPPIEQESIVAFLDHSTKRVDGVISKTLLSIDLLKERRSALITAAVTGQIDLREVV